VSPDEPSLAPALAANGAGAQIAGSALLLSGEPGESVPLAPTIPDRIYRPASVPR
jgi:hypothetical protein